MKTKKKKKGGGGGGGGGEEEEASGKQPLSSRASLEILSPLFRTWFFCSYYQLSRFYSVFSFIYPILSCRVLSAALTILCSSQQTPGTSLRHSSGSWKKVSAGKPMLGILWTLSSKERPKHQIALYDATSNRWSVTWITEWRILVMSPRTMDSFLSTAYNAP